MWGGDRKWVGDFLETRSKALRDSLDQKKKRRSSGVCFISHCERLLQGRRRMQESSWESTASPQSFQLEMLDGAEMASFCLFIACVM